jgi:hypothetical protein
MGKRTGVVAPAEVQHAVIRMVRDLAVDGAARELGIGREQVLRIVGRFGVRAGTIAIVRERLWRREQPPGGHDVE